jgi:hypothetical protein
MRSKLGSAAEFVSMVQEMRALLLEERRLLKAGHAPEVAEVSREKLRILLAMEAAGRSEIDPTGRAEVAVAIEEIQRLAQENGMYLIALQRGIRSLASRISDLSGGQAVGAYGPAGKKLPFSRAPGVYAKRV